MKKVKIKRKELNCKEFIRRKAKQSDYKKLITEDTVVIDADSNKPVILYCTLDKDTIPLERQLNKLKFGSGKRTRGLKSSSSIFGYRPRNEIRQDYCSATAWALNNPESHAVVCSFAEEMERLYKEFLTESFEVHKNLISDKVLDDYKINDTIFTSGITNKNSALAYHFDTGNFKDCMSAMITIKRDVSGGYLSIPEYDIGLELKQGSVLIFNGQDIMHGVTPINFYTPKAYRYTMVYYSLSRIWQCEPIDDEIARVRNVKHKREQKRLLIDKDEEAKEEWLKIVSKNKKELTHKQKLLLRKGKQ